MRALHLILMVAVFFCGLHLAEPVQAHGEAAHYQFDQPAEHGHDEDGKGSAEAAHAMHHHCPIAPDQSFAGGCASFRAPALVFAAPAASLVSLAQAPPVEPPAA